MGFPPPLRESSFPSFFHSLHNSLVASSRFAKLLPVLSSLLQILPTCLSNREEDSPTEEELLEVDTTSKSLKEVPFRVRRVSSTTSSFPLFLSFRLSLTSPFFPLFFLSLFRSGSRLPQPQPTTAVPPAATTTAAAAWRSVAFHWRRTCWRRRRSWR